MGYKVEQFVKKVDENLICPICQSVFQDPVMCVYGHTFCKTCIDDWLEESDKCPVDGQLINHQSLSRNFALCGILDKLDVYCHIPSEWKERPTAGLEDHQQPTCDWIGKLQFLAKHKETCPFQQVQCPNVNCNTYIQKRELKDHDMLCQHKTVLCHECRFVLIRNQLEGHKKDDCPESLVLCPNRCTDVEDRVVRFKRKESMGHLKDGCAKTVMDCPFKDQGCQVQVERQHVKKHLQDKTAVHMILLAQQCSSLTRENQLLANKLKKVKNDFELMVISRSCYVWTILDYPAKAKKYNNGKWMRSPNFWLCGNSWFLKLYPNGADERSKDYVSLCLVLSHEDTLVQTGKSSMVPSSEVSVPKVRVTVRNQDQKPNITQDVTLKPRLDEPCAVREVAVIRELIRTDDALSPAFCGVVDGSFTVTCIFL